MLLELPNEIILLVLACLEDEDHPEKVQATVAACAATCRRMHQLCNPVLYREPTPRSIPSLVHLARTMQSAPRCADMMVSLSLSVTKERWLYTHVDDMTNAISDIVHCAHRINSVDLGQAEFLGDRVVQTIAESLGASLQFIDLETLRITDVGVLALIHHCPNIVEINLTDAFDVTDASVFEMASKWAKSVETVKLAGNPNVTWLSLDTLIKSCTSLKLLDCAGVFIEWELAGWTDAVRAAWTERGLTVVMDEFPDNVSDNGSDAGSLPPQDDFGDMVFDDDDDDDFDDEDGEDDDMLDNFAGDVGLDAEDAMHLMSDHHFPPSVSAMMQQYATENNVDMNHMPHVHFHFGPPYPPHLPHPHTHAGGKPPVTSASAAADDENEWTDEEVYEGTLDDHTPV
ncbi:hypothetical protein RI367_003090 [Sorochytrium milnesiophthora]